MTHTLELPSIIEPCLCLIAGNFPVGTSNLASSLIEETSILSTKLHPKTAQSVANLVRVMNCHYSNLIEGHNTKLIDIERAMTNDFSSDEKNRNLQLEARAHIRIQAKIDALFFSNQLPMPTSLQFIKWLHKEFYNEASEVMLNITENGKKAKVIPGELRIDSVSIGRHIPPSPDVLLNFMAHFSTRYDLSKMNKLSQVMSIAAAHHRFSYIHPFLDGNGRVSRLLSHAMAMYSGIGVNGVWSISRGLAKGLSGADEYKKRLNNADSPRQGDYDGRGNLSLKELISFTDWFLTVCIDQVTFMSSILDLGHMKNHLDEYVYHRGLKPESKRILKNIFIFGEMPRGEAEDLTGFKERQARNILASLTEDGILCSHTPKGNVFLNFNMTSAPIIFPKLFYKEFA